MTKLIERRSVGRTVVSKGALLFVSAHPQGSRFNGPDRGAWYAGFEAEVAYHKSIELAEIGWFDEESHV
jgi:hypothetical protein